MIVSWASHQIGYWLGTVVGWDVLYYSYDAPIDAPLPIPCWEPA